jgi:hypothetical protein
MTIDKQTVFVEYDRPQDKCPYCKETLDDPDNSPKIDTEVLQDSRLKCYCRDCERSWIEPLPFQALKAANVFKANKPDAHDPALIAQITDLRQQLNGYKTFIAEQLLSQNRITDMAVDMIEKNQTALATLVAECKRMAEIILQQQRDINTLKQKVFWGNSPQSP